jgi:hypothetical protein
VEAHHLHPTRFELIVERKVRRRKLTDDGNVEITGRDLREQEAAPTATGSASAELLDKCGTTSRSRRWTPISCQSQDRGAMRSRGLDKFAIHALLY